MLQRCSIVLSYISNTNEIYIIFFTTGLGFLNQKTMSLFKIAKELNFDSLSKILCSSLNEKVNVNNVGFSLAIANLFSGDDYSLSFIERWFTVVAENKQFLDYSINELKQIFDSPFLNITSEHQLVYAADMWIKHDTSQRRKFAIELIEKIRLPLLSHAALNSILKGKTSFSECVKCLKHINCAIDEKANKADPTSVNYQSRYCGQQNFDLLVSGLVPFDINHRHVYQFQGGGFSEILQHDYDIYIKNKKVEIFHDVDHKAVVFVGGVVYFVNNKFMRGYSVLTKQYLPEQKLPHVCTGFSAVAFMGRLFILGGGTTRCRYFVPKTQEWCAIEQMSEETIHSSCTIFEGKIVASGGTEYPGNPRRRKGVEIYDFFADTWSPMPDMLDARSGHSSVSIRNKLYIIGGCMGSNYCETYDSFSGNFAYIKPILYIEGGTTAYRFSWVTMGNKLVFFHSCYGGRGYPLPLISAEYDIETDEWVYRRDMILPNVMSTRLFAVKVPKL